MHSFAMIPVQRPDMPPELTRLGLSRWVQFLGRGSLLDFGADTRNGVNVVELQSMLLNHSM